MSFEFSGRMRDERPRSIFDVIKTKEIKVVSEKYFSLYGFTVVSLPGCTRSVTGFRTLITLTATVWCVCLSSLRHRWFLLHYPLVFQ